MAVLDNEHEFVRRVKLALLTGAGNLDTKRLVQDHPDLVARYSVPKPGVRRFLISAKADQP